MNKHLVLPATLLFVITAQAQEIPNQLIDYGTFQENVASVGALRASRRISELQFIRMAKQPGTVILDARSAEKYALLHVKGAKNLSLPDITEDELAKIIPSKSTRILIYCNNNFLNEPRAFPSKNIAVALNVHTFVSLNAYGYTNVYELGPLIDIGKSSIPFEGELAARRQAALAP